ncbi:MAG: hypothetical protein LUQ67_02440 [Methanomicrobiales archaeon]|nr:hypothetical protein [Methanomicrobiales archaeon]
MSIVDVNIHTSDNYRDHTSSNEAELYIDPAWGGTDQRQLTDALSMGVHHTVSRYNSSSQVLDGLLDGSIAPYSYSSITKPSLTGYVGVGAWFMASWPGYTDVFRGTLDEVRISNIARSNSWIQTGYANQNSPSTFISVGSQMESGCTTPTPTTTTTTTTTTPTPTPVSCSVAVDATSSGTTIQTQTITISHTTYGSDRLMLVGVSINNNGLETVSSITYNGDALTRVGYSINTMSGGDDARVEIWKLVAPDTGTHNVVVTFSSSLAFAGGAGVMTFTGVDQTTPNGTFAKNQGDDQHLINVTVPSATNELAFGVLASEYNSATSDSGQTERWNYHIYSSDWTNGVGGTKAGEASVMLKWNLSSSVNHWATAGVSIKPCGTRSLSYVQSKSQMFGGASQAAITLPRSSITGDLMILSLVFGAQSLGVTSVSDSNGNAYTLAVGPTDVDSWGKGYTYYAKNIIGGGPITITATLSGVTGSVFDVFALEYSGIFTSNPLDQVSDKSSSGTAMDSGSKTITSAPSLIYGFGADEGACLSNSPYTDRETTDGQCAMDQTVLSTGSYSVTATQSGSGYYLLQMATFKGW